MSRQSGLHKIHIIYCCCAVDADAISKWFFVVLSSSLIVQTYYMTYQDCNTQSAQWEMILDINYHSKTSIKGTEEITLLNEILPHFDWTLFWKFCHCALQYQCPLPLPFIIKTQEAINLMEKRYQKKCFISCSTSPPALWYPPSQPLNAERVITQFRRTILPCFYQCFNQCTVANAFVKCS